MSPAGIGLAMASWIAYMTMNGVLNASVSAGSSHRAASVTCRAQRSSPAGGLPAWARADVGSAPIAVTSTTARRKDTGQRGRARSNVSGMAPTLVWSPTQVNRSITEGGDRVDRTSRRG